MPTAPEDRPIELFRNGQRHQVEPGNGSPSIQRRHVADPALRDVTGDQTRAEDLAQRLLVLRCQAGDEIAFARLMRTFEARTLGYLHGLVGDDAEDVQQEVWLSVYRHLGLLADPGAFRTWLFRTTRHRAIDFLRKRKRERELIDDMPLEDLLASRGGTTA
jgi:DNA-directed RNA polymerase specialized sigma24 family protein